jgi:hypothetical protein
MGKRQPNPIDPDVVRQFFDYEDGALKWKIKKGRANVGDVAWKSCNGYKMFNLNRKTYQEHRLIWAWHYDTVPDEIDHINGDFLDNRIENLREATHRQNMYNRKTPSHNKTGVKGVYMAHGKYRSQITKDGKITYLGSFSCLTAAKMAVENARTEMHMEFANNG